METIDRNHPRSDIRSVDYDREAQNRQDAEREWTYVAAGSLLIALGGWFIYQGARSRPARPFALPNPIASGSRKSQGLHLRESVTVNRPADQLYAFWRKLENLPRVMTHLESVEELSNTRSHWVASGPVGTSVSWDATITDDRPGEAIAWRSDPDSQVPNEGAVAFVKRGSETEIVVSLTYHPPGGAVGGAIARLFGEAPSQQIRDDLDRFKSEVESGKLILG